MSRARGLTRAGFGIAVAAMFMAPAIPAYSSAPAATAVSGLARARAQLPMLRAAGAHGMMAQKAGDVTASQAAPAGAISPNVEFLSNLPLPTAISIVFIGNTAFVSTVEGLFSVDITDPTNPSLLGSIPMYIWENEHMTADPAHNLVIIARDPRGFTSPATTAFPYGATHVIDVSNPKVMTQVSFHTQPTGHTATCINNCTFLWIAGPASPAVAVAGGADPTWGGRPMWGLDISDPAHPVDCPHFIDLNNHDGKTDYDHDVDVDAQGIAWISGSGHIRGFWTSGRHLNPIDGKVETATGCEPIPAGGGNTDEGQLAVQGGVIHNSFRNMAVGVDGRPGDVVAATEEVNTTDCTKSGRFLTYDVGGSFGGADWTNAANHPYVLRKLGTWTPENQGGSNGCDSAHWFTDRGDGLVAIAFYTQGTRILDINDPRHIREVGFFNVKDQTGQSTNNTWAAYWHGDNYIYVADFQRGLDVLRFHGERAGAVKTAGPISAPPAAPAAVGGSVLPNTTAAGGFGERTIAAIAALAVAGQVAWFVARRRRRRGARRT